MIITRENFRQYPVGKKAENLFIMQEHGFHVPGLFCTDASCGEEAADYARREYPDTKLFSVRSSSAVEDRPGASFAGQFHTYLRVPHHQLAEYVKKTSEPLKSQGFEEYCRRNGMNTDEISVAVIVQEMIEAELSGVIFTANPQGILNETVIVVGRGTGDHVVEDKVDATTYYCNTTDGQYYYERKGDSPLLNADAIREFLAVSAGIKELFGCECDIEFAVKDSILYILQARPITTLPESGDPIVLDNSNIVESYPGITLPLTQSFIREAYYRVFRSLLLRLTGENKTVDNADEILRNMVDACNGRIYYRISNWYDVILFLPFSKKIIPVWQEMLGVKTKTVTFHTKQKVGFLTHAKVTLSFFRFLFSCPKQMEKLDGYFTDIMKEYRSVDLSTASDREILEHYHKLMTKVSDQWDITLANDMYSFLYTGLLKAHLKNDETANSYISGLNGIESMKPVKALNRIAEQAKGQNRLEELGRISSNEEFYRYIAEKSDSFTKALEEYIEFYGDRNINELKLESKTFRTDPILLIREILKYAENGMPITSETEQKPVRGLAGFFAKRAALGIKNREKSRLHRSRLYGMMRAMMLKIGENLTAKGILDQREDIFLLTYEQVESAVTNGEDMKRTVLQAAEKYEMFRRLPAYSRLIFAGDVFDKNPSSIGEMQFSGGGKSLRGVPCSRGCVEGEVLLMDDPTLTADARGKILVTRMTDPGWVFLIAAAKGIVAEKGSLLSHTAIISRELKRPAIVGVDNVTEILKNGDMIRMDGGSGEIEILSRKG